jgi:transposase
MRFVGIDIAAETHVVAAVSDTRQVVLKPTSFTEDAVGYQKLRELLGAPDDTLVAMEATGHYWQNLFAVLVDQGFTVALLNPLRTRRFAEEDLERTKTDAIDALALARFAAEKRPAVAQLPDAARQELRELVRHRDRLLQDFGDRTRQLHRLVDLGFPEFVRHVRRLDSELATAILHRYPTARAFQGVSVLRLAKLRYDGRHLVGEELARTLVEAAPVSVGQHHGEAYRLQVRHACEDLDLLRRRLRELDRSIAAKLAAHEVGTLLTTIDGIGPHTAARIIAELGDPASFGDAGALAAFVGVVPALRHSGKRRPLRAGLTPHGHARLRAALWMPTLTAVRRNPWLRQHYERLRARGKLPKIALVACMHKLLLAVHSVARHRRPFTPHLAPAEVTA